MISVLRTPSYAKLFGAQIVALVGTGLLTVALGLLAFDIARGDAGIVMGVAMTIKMVAYVAVAPLATALVARLSRKPVLIGADLVRAGVAVSLPMVTQAWQIYILILLLQSASATFTPTFQAVIPSVLPDEGDYTRALSLSRLAYDLESVLSPMLAAVLLTVIGFIGSAVLVASTRFPHIEVPPSAPFLERLTRGVRLFWRIRELRGLMGLNLVVATTTAMVIVNTVVLVQAHLGRSQSDVALLLGVYGTGSMVVALGMPALLDRLPDRRVMVAGGLALPVLLLVAAGVIARPASSGQWVALLVVWTLLGAATSTILTPSSRLLRRNSQDQTRPAVFSAQFSLSHACFLITYPLAGALGAAIGLPAVAVVLVVVGVLGLVAALLAWRPVSTGSRDHRPTVSRSRI
ncbi:MFS transporter [Acidipropionibacterium jensenii]|uniref:MFS transporter n=2 Tax=Acidipropionibacterium jensenii TaxID=1749 RepID=UPI0026492A3D|nr:MFS transporter [Acidipropionibacterium jensenii]MDN5996762.1 MFS transporter [Acidipropionibacterium jensenii]MDN6427314.1 MFS transporter [Acidipropionibacterium jensenii]MDN6479671.1 MFS transporter [Acidipropionibacterium jensenii]MDN6512275.1 MFS transporter [Acidipropionibacterium jensenii]MDN6592505.1 MFS transporter [Acidipropionibacterium jensenii]